MNKAEERAVLERAASAAYIKLMSLTYGNHALCEELAAAIRALLLSTESTSKSAQDATATPRSEAAWNASPVGDMTPLLVLCRQLERECSELKRQLEAALTDISGRSEMSLILQAKYEQAEADARELWNALEVCKGAYWSREFVEKHRAKYGSKT